MARIRLSRKHPLTPKVFREGAENRARGGRAPDFNNVFRPYSGR
jgi:hypothetical protein